MESIRPIVSLLKKMNEKGGHMARRAVKKMKKNACTTNERLSKFVRIVFQIS